MKGFSAEQLFYLAEELLLLLYLGLLAREDLKDRRLSGRVLLAGGLLGLGLRLAELLWLRRAPRALAGYLPGLVPAAVLAWLSFRSKGAVGPGDGLCILTLCPWLKAGELFTLLLTAAAALSLIGLVLWMKKGRPKDYALPFLPFLAGSRLLLVLAGALSAASP